MAAVREPERRERELFGRLRLALPKLDALLRAEGFVVGPDRWQNVYDLLLALQASRRMPPQAAALRPLLTPLFCRDADEQTRFAEVFRRWLEALSTEPDAVDEPPLVERALPPDPPPQPSRRRLIIGLLLGALALAAVSYGVVYFSAKEPPATEQKLPEPPPSTEPSGKTDQPAESLIPQPLPPRTPLEQPQTQRRQSGLVEHYRADVESIARVGTHWLSRCALAELESGAAPPYGPGRGAASCDYAGC